MVLAQQDPTLPHRASMRLESLVGRSVALAELFRRLKPAAAIERLPILLTGASGSGKSLVARVIHHNGPRPDAPFVEVNCGAIPAELWEAEFFGSSRNAYTQAVERAGRFAAAEGGTLFLDEVGEIPAACQPKLLRVLDEGMYERLGEDRTRRACVRVIAATNRDLAGAVADGKLRQDLYFRLNRYRVRVPSLAERREDVAELARGLAARACKTLELPPIPVSPLALWALEQREWPGNVRELESVISQAVAEAWAEGAAQIEPHHCADPCAAGCEPQARAALEPLPPARSFAEATQDFQRRLLSAELVRAHWNVTRVSRSLDLSRSRVYELMHEFALVRPGAAPQPAR
jgi:Nif-specific regulatory protein